MPTTPLLSNEFLAQKIVDTSEKVVGIEAGLKHFLDDHTALKADVGLLKSDVSELKTARRTDRAYIAGIVAITSPIAAILVMGAKMAKDFLQ